MMLSFRFPRRFTMFCSLVLALCFTAGAQAATVLITGANSGIGLELAKQYAEKGWTVIATHRRDTTPDSLAELAAKHKNVRPERMDVQKPDDARALAARMRGEPIDVLINNAGIYSLGDWLDRTDVSQRFGTLDYAAFDHFMQINVRGPVSVTEAFVDNVRKGAQKKVITVTSTIGTISTPEVSTNAFWYGTSKAALNKATVTLAAVLKPDGIIVVPMHPGSVRVEKQASANVPGMIDTPDSARAMIRTIDSLTLKDSAKFTNYDGKRLPW
jgi:NAD(P)-dependent dehydrogenase (short-subunit alcohol dehydrogenase family)